MSFYRAALLKMVPGLMGAGCALADSFGIEQLANQGKAHLRRLKTETERIDERQALCDALTRLRKATSLVLLLVLLFTAARSDADAAKLNPHACAEHSS